MVLYIIVVTGLLQLENINFVSNTQIILHLLHNVCSLSSPSLCVFIFSLLWKRYCSSNSCSCRYTCRWIMLLIIPQCTCTARVTNFVCVSRVCLAEASLGSMPRKSYVLHFIGFFHSWISKQKLPFESYGVICLPYAYGYSYRAIATTHGSSFDGISFACCLKAMHSYFSRLFLGSGST